MAMPHTEPLEISSRPLGPPPVDRARIRRALRSLALEALGRAHPSEVVRLEVEAPPMRPLGWVREQTAAHRGYWTGREEPGETAVAGAAFVLEGAGFEAGCAAADRAHALLAEADGAARFYGGMRFDPETPPAPEWAAYGGYRFVLPRFELRTHAGATTLACNLYLPEDRRRPECVLGAINALSLEARAPVVDLPEPLSRTARPDADAWNDAVGAALEAIGAGTLEKVVLARAARVRFARPLDAFGLLEALAPHAPATFRFAFAAGASVFIGASPERLYRRSGRLLASEAVAGTRPRGRFQRDDSRLAEELLASDKDLREHGVVRDYLSAALRTLCDLTQVDEEARLMTLAHGRHLHTGVRGTLRADVGDGAVLAALHPTPAVGGFPRPASLEAIRRLEPFDRGWYAGPVGWVGREEAEFAVAIRSARLQGAEMTLYSGAGIVEGSRPEAEWREVEQKLGPYAALLRLDAA